MEDIYALHTFGFRGEALASIAAVAQVELRTRQTGDEVGTVTEIHGGKFLSQKPVMCPVGSQFFVRNLFFNVPARRRFPGQEHDLRDADQDRVPACALCYPQIAFDLYANDAPILSLPATTLAGRIVDIAGRHMKQNLLEIDADTSIARVAGYVGRPAAAKKRNAEQYLFVNGRYFKSAYLASAILKAYEKLIPATEQPAYFLYLTIDPARIDVNVHPQKTEVKFADEEAVWQIVHAAVRETLAKTGAVPPMDFDREGQVEIPVMRQGVVYSEPSAMSNENYNPFRESYIDPTAPDPNVDFTGFDVPYDGRTLSDAGSSSPNSAAGWQSVPPRFAEFASAAPKEEFEDFESASDFAETAPLAGAPGIGRTPSKSHPEHPRSEYARFHTLRGGARAAAARCRAASALSPIRCRWGTDTLRRYLTDVSSSSTSAGRGSGSSTRIICGCWAAVRPSASSCSSPNG